MTYLSDLFANGTGPLGIFNAMVDWVERGADPLAVCSPATLPVACRAAIEHAMALGWLLGLISW